MSSNLQIWLAGASGMLGNKFQQILRQQNISFVPTDHQIVDLTNLKEVQSFIKSNHFTHIINCAAYTNVDLAEKELEQAFKVNAEAVRNLAIESKKKDVKLVSFSTDYVFDGKGSEPYTETAAAVPLNVYGQSKLQGEKWLTGLSDAALIIRSSWLFDERGKNFVRTMLLLMQQKEELKVVDDQVGSPTYCEDLCLATLALLPKSGIFHFAGSGHCSWYAFSWQIFEIAKQLGIPLNIKNILPISTGELEQKAKRPCFSVLDCNKFIETAGFKPRPWQIALRECLIKISELRLDA